MFEWWGIPRQGWFIILAELSAIIGLSTWVVTEYLNNIYFQSYVNGLAPILVPVLSVAFGVASASAATILYFGMKNLRRSDATASAVEPSRKRSQPKKTARNLGGDVKPLRTVASPSNQPPRLKPIAPPRSSASRDSSTRPAADKKERT